MFGFTKVDLGGDHNMARFLRKHKCIYNPQQGPANSVTWRGPGGEAVVVAFYDNTNCTYTTWVRDDR